MKSDDSNDLNLPVKKDRVVQPLPEKPETDGKNEAVELIRQKISTLYAVEPDVKEELEDSKTARHRSKHQQFMYDLSRSGKSLAEIQTAWHEYYVNLPDREKHEVWQEFYTDHAKLSHLNKAQTKVREPANKPVIHAAPRRQAKPVSSDKRSPKDIKRHITQKVSSRSKRHKPGRFRSLAFGFGMGVFVLAIMMFGFFNERFVAPFITPSRTISSTPMILDATAAVGPEPKVIIPKINVDIPVVYDEKSIEEAAVQKALEEGVIHYGITENPGEKGNAVFFGHSSNNLLNRGKYKFAFVLLNKLEKGDTFMLHYGGKRYVYKIFEKRVVHPTEVSVLNDVPGKASTATLITCDPPGTSLNRLVVIGEQISPDPDTNLASSSTDQVDTVKPAVLPSNSPSLWQRFTGWLTS